MSQSQILRFVRVFVGTALPAILAYVVSVDEIISVPVVAVIAGALQVAYRVGDPAAGTSQFYRFLRVGAFAAVPQLVALATVGLDAQVAGLAAAVTGAMEMAFRQAYPHDADVVDEYLAEQEAINRGD